MAAGLNWHLFDTIDVKKFETGEVLHLPTSPMVGFNEDLWVTEQLPVDGVPFPDFDNGQLFSWGIIEGTRIGYIYGWGWFWDAEEEFYDAVRQLMYDDDTEGLIIDFRFNTGGNMFLSDRALELLFDQTIGTIDFAVRCDDADHLGLCAVGNAEDYLIQGDPGSFYDKPIAVLTGPGAVSSGDQVALRFKFHPNARFFGKSTNTLFSSPDSIQLLGGRRGQAWLGSFARADAFLVSELDDVPVVEDFPGLSDYHSRIHRHEWWWWQDSAGAAVDQGAVLEADFLTHDPLAVDYPVWLTPDDVAAGRDSVVEAAVQWITTSGE
jgi:hypothetical protein